MVTGLELAILALVVILLVGTHRVIRAVKPLIVNAVVGLIVLLLASAIGFGVAVTPVVVLIVALGGGPARCSSCCSPTWTSCSSRWSCCHCNDRSQP